MARRSVHASAEVVVLRAQTWRPGPSSASCCSGASALTGPRAAIAAFEADDLALGPLRSRRVELGRVVVVSVAHGARRAPRPRSQRRTSGSAATRSSLGAGDARRRPRCARRRGRATARSLSASPARWRQRRSSAPATARSLLATTARAARPCARRGERGELGGEDPHAPRRYGACAAVSAALSGYLEAMAPLGRLGLDAGGLDVDLGALPRRRRRRRTGWRRPRGPACSTAARAASSRAPASRRRSASASIGAGQRAQLGFMGGQFEPDVVEAARVPHRAPAPLPPRAAPPRRR